MAASLYWSALTGLLDNKPVFKVVVNAENAVEVYQDVTPTVIRNGIQLILGYE